jgi:tetratricopeptide (TPR) repeat protein
VKLVAAFLGTALLAALAAPELPRYSAERRVGWATAAFQQLLDSSQPQQGGDTLRRLQAVGEMALSTTTALPGDPRPWMIGASSYLVTGQPQRALDFYRAALGTGERSEIDLNLGRAYAGLNRRDASDAALLRAGWISPEILSSLPRPSRDALLVKIADLDADLRAGRLAAPPPLPEDALH